MPSPIPKTVGRPAESTAGPTENLIRPVERDDIGNGGGTTGIARNVELYNLAFKFAWKYISEHQKLHVRPDIARQLHDSIRRELRREQAKPLSLLPRRFRILATNRDEPSTAGRCYGTRARRQLYKKVICI
jgi:hypothetical protein